LISIKKYLDRNDPALTVAEPEPDELLAVTMDSYRSALHAFGSNAVEACPAPGRDLEHGLVKLESSLSIDASPKAVKQTQEQVEAQLAQWGHATAGHLKEQADEVKELLLLLAGTAESVGERDQRYTQQFTGLTADLKAIANLDDLTQVRSSLVRKATELKICVDQMAQDGQQSIAQLRSKVTSYETKLKAVEEIASKDTVTGLANRRSVESRMERLIALHETFCAVILDLNRFKQINDKHGHPAGDDLLKKFAHELQNNVRSEDMVGRWGGDEFIVVLRRDVAGAKPQIERIRHWVFGSYTVEAGAGKATLKVDVTAAVGVAEWSPGMTMKQVIAQADAAMYRDKRESQKRTQ
jgi:diguanylate cyclase (GGDEF)-like protein